MNNVQDHWTSANDTFPGSITVLNLQFLLQCEFITMNNAAMHIGSICMESNVIYGGLYFMQGCTHKSLKNCSCGSPHQLTHIEMISLYYNYHNKMHCSHFHSLPKSVHSTVYLIRFIHTVILAITEF